MAAMILIVANDGPAAGHLVRTLRQAGHTPILASDARTALEEAADAPDLILLDLVGVPHLPGEELLRRLDCHPETAQIPVLVLTEQPEAAAPLRGPENGSAVATLCKPVSGAQLRQVVDTALASHGEQDPDALRLARERQGELIRRLILEGPDPLVFHVYRRLCADRTRPRGLLPPEALSWTEISVWAKREGLLDAEQARLLRRVPLAEPQKAGDDPA